jgi:hypothetical protein
VANADHAGVTVCDVSKFGVHVDGVRVDPKRKQGEVLLVGDAAAKTECEIRFGCAKPLVYAGRLVFTERADPEGSGEDATTDGDATDAEEETARNANRAGANDEQENRAVRNVANVEPVSRRAMTPLQRTRPFLVEPGADASESNATTVFEPLPARNTHISRRVLSSARLDGDRRPNFKTFKKQKLGPATADSTERFTVQPNRQRVLVRYADDAYDALPQWEDARVAAERAAERADARRAEEMFEESSRAAKKPLPRRRGAAARGK